MKKASDRKRLEDLKAFIVLCFGLMRESDDPKAVANQTGLSLSTIYRLANPGNITLATHYNTVDVVGRAAGIKLVVSEQGRSEIQFRPNTSKRKKVTA